MTETPSACQCFCELLWYFLSSVNSSLFLKEKDYCTLTSHDLIRFYTTDSSYTLRCCLFSVASHLRIYFDLMKEGCKKLKGKSSIIIYMPKTYTSPWLLLAVSFSLFYPYRYMFLLLHMGFLPQLTGKSWAYIPEKSPTGRIFNSCALHLLSTPPSHPLTFSSYNQRVARLQLCYNVTYITVSVREEAKCCWFIFHSPPNMGLKGLELKLGCTETLKTQTHSRLSYSLISNPLGPSFHTGLTL